MQIGDVHCKHVIFGGSADNGYARMLAPYLGHESVTRQITMLEGPPFAPELARLVPHFTTTSFATVFRNTKLPSRRVSFSTTPPQSTTPKPASWASAVTMRPTTSTEDMQEPLHTLELKVGAIPRNAYGQRVDMPLSFSQALFPMLKAAKLCNPYHLTEKCPFSSCNYTHGRKLEGIELTTLRYVARLAPCKWGLDCSDSNCILGHRCVRTRCDGGDCRFSYDMHNVDTKIVGH